MITCKQANRDLLSVDAPQVSFGFLQCRCLSFQVTPNKLSDGSYVGHCGGCGRVESLDYFFVNPLEGFDGEVGVVEWLEMFADRFDYETAAFDVAGREITFGAVRDAARKAYNYGV